MRDPFYDRWPAGRGLRAQLIYLVDIIANVTVGLLGLCFLLFILLWVFGDTSPYPHHR